MKKPVLFAALAPLVLGACSAFPEFNAHRAGNHAIITQMHCDQEGDRLRLAVKDNIDVQGIVTSAGSQYFATTHKPAAKDAPCLALARARNVQIIGKSNLSEFAVSPSGVNEYYGTPRNPFCFFHKRIPGGSSSGSAVAVAGGFCDVALGTDTAGSIRVPAACCGVVGLKTTKGLVPIQGVHPIEPEHLDTVGPIGKDIASTIVGMDLLESGFMEKYAKVKAAHPSAGGLRVGRLHLKGTDPKIDAAIDEALTKTGFQVVQLDPKLADKWEQAKTDGGSVAAAGAWISDKDFANKPGVSLRTKVVILAGHLKYNFSYQSALSRRAAWQATLAETFRKVDFIALPTLQSIPASMPHGIDLGQLEAETLKLQNAVAVNYAGNPAIALPVPLRGSSFSVTSLQLIGPNKSEANLLLAGHYVETAVRKSRRADASYDMLAAACPYTQTSKVLRD